MKKTGKIHIGTSGWNYRHWKGTFYPQGTKDKDQLAYYIEHFKTVELNSPFYRIPAPATFEKWGNAVPEDFLFAVKANRLFTHLKKLHVTEDEIEPFFSGVAKLKDKCGVILFQLPPGWKLDLERLAHFLDLLPADFRYTFEFRNPTWYDEQVYALLRKYNIAFCIYELGGHQSPVLSTADFVYIRLHGPGAKYQGSYTDEALQEWADLCREWRSEGKDVFIYFDNDQLGYAAFNAAKLRSIL